MRQLKKIRPEVENQIDMMRQAGFREETIKRRLKDIGMPDSKLKLLGLPVAEAKSVPTVEMESEADFLKDVSAFLEHAHRELSPVRSKYPDAVANLMSWHRKIERRVSQLRPANED